MLRRLPEPRSGILSGIVGYDSVPTARKITVPLRAINDDLDPTDVAAIRTVNIDFDAIVMRHVGHYPMLERPDEFKQHVAAVVAVLDERH